MGYPNGMTSDTDRGDAIINPDDVANSYVDSDVPGELRRLTDALDGDQLAVTLNRVPAHCDFEHGTGHHHKQTEEVYLVTSGSGRFKVDDDIVEVSEGGLVFCPPAAVREWEAGEDGLEIVAFGAHAEDDGNMFPGWWTD